MTLVRHELRTLNRQTVAGNEMTLLVRIIAVVALCVYVAGALTAANTAQWADINLLRAATSFLLAALPLGALLWLAFGDGVQRLKLQGTLAALGMCFGTLWLAHALLLAAVDCPNAAIGARGTNWCKSTYSP